MKAITDYEILSKQTVYHGDNRRQENLTALHLEWQTVYLLDISHDAEFW